uniref:Uncharacterized protein n=1 Tax=Eutreptiella gymnastica TaxID=73025 RepID=A0A7S4CDC8_9EUGL|mmetsp:Transcript_86321/g.143593  ORF Transcript_86321/g.143593 Transcript_86321/m.143593 type:complete len:108 (-) Transcript_86321:619-942(-)
MDRSAARMTWLALRLSPAPALELLKNALVVQRAASQREVGGWPPRRCLLHVWIAHPEQLYAPWAAARPLPCAAAPRADIFNGMTDTLWALAGASVILRADAFIILIL